MSTMTRRKFVNRGGAAAVAVAGAGIPTARLLGLRDDAQPEGSSTGAQAAILYDSTLCIGCRACELACNEENELGRSTDEIFQGCTYQDQRALGTSVFSCVTQHAGFPDPSEVAFGKVQCMHCVDPACAAVCPVSAMEKTPAGPVIWHPELCLGCRFCMMACPFQVPRFEWDSANPRIRKCEMCHDRIQEGKAPACVGICPSGALSFGTRDEILAEARARIERRPRDYVHHVYGESEAGGTTFLHLAGHPFEDLGYWADLPERSPAEATRPAMAAVPFVLNGLAILLGGSAWLRRRAGRLEPLKGEEEEK